MSFVKKLLYLVYIIINIILENGLNLSFFIIVNFLNSSVKVLAFHRKLSRQVLWNAY